MGRLCILIEKAFVDHQQKILLVYLVVAACAFLYPVYIAFKFTYFAVHIPDGLQNVFAIAGNEYDSASLLQLINVVKRQSISNEILADFVHEWPSIMIVIPVLSMMLINRNGFVPLFLKIWKRGVHWAAWMTFCIVATAAVCFAAIETIQYLLSSPVTFPPDQLVHETFRTDLAAAFEQVLARRKTLAICLIIHGVATIGTVVSAILIPFLRIIWAPRYVAHGKAMATGPSMP
ncbi:MAG: hypothetical protein J6Q49_01580 [Kiritimatiellae bacterium]|nr:hypothetical protein [Kiritimatiellia bacterium]